MRNVKRNSTISCKKLEAALFSALSLAIKDGGEMAGQVDGESARHSGVQRFIQRPAAAGSGGALSQSKHPA